MTRAPRGRIDGQVRHQAVVVSMASKPSRSVERDHVAAGREVGEGVAASATAARAASAGPGCGRARGRTRRRGCRSPRRPRRPRAASRTRAGRRRCARRARSRNPWLGVSAATSARSTRPRRPRSAGGSGARAGTSPPPAESSRTIGASRALPTSSMDATLGSRRPAAGSSATAYPMLGRTPRSGAPGAALAMARLGRMPSVVIAAHNEAAVLGRCLDACSADAPARRVSRSSSSPTGAPTARPTWPGRAVGRTVLEIAAAQQGRRAEPRRRGRVGFPAHLPRRRHRGHPGRSRTLCAALAGPGAPLVAVPSRRLELTGRPPGRPGLLRRPAATCRPSRTACSAGA